MTSSKISSAPCSRVHLAQPLEEAGRRRHHAHVAGHRLDDDRRDRDRRADGRDRAPPPRSLKATVSVSSASAAGTPLLSGIPKRRAARAGLHEQAVGVPVIAAVELDEQVAPGGAAGHADGAHRGLGARADQPHHLHRRVGGRERPRPSRPRAPWARRSWCRAPGRLGDRLDHRRGGVAEDERPPRADEVDVRPAVGVPQAARPHRAAMNGGAPPTARNARTGLLTPPGNHAGVAASRRRLDSPGIVGQAPRATKSRRSRPTGRRPSPRPAPATTEVTTYIGGRIGRLARRPAPAAVGFGEVRAGVDVRVIDHRHAEALALEIADTQEILGVDVVRGARVTRIALRDRARAARSARCGSAAGAARRRA